MTNRKPTNQPRRLDRGQQVTNFIRYSITEGLKDIREEMHAQAEDTEEQMASTPTADQIKTLYEEFQELHQEWLKINLTPTGRLRTKLKPEKFERSEEIRKRSNTISKQICQLTNEKYESLSA